MREKIEVNINRDPQISFDLWWLQWTFAVVCGTVFASCTMSTNEVCDESKQIDFRIMGDIIGEWRYASGNTAFRIDEEGHLFGEGFGCEFNHYPLVPGESNPFPGGLGNYDVRLVKVELEPGRFLLGYKRGYGEEYEIKTLRAELRDPNQMRYYHFSSDFVVLDRWRPDEEEVAATATSILIEPSNAIENAIGDSQNS